MNTKPQLAKRTEITIETRSVMRIKTTATTELFCGDCSEIVVPVLGWQVARAIGINEEHLEFLRLKGEIHTLGEAGICSASLAKYLERSSYVEKKS